MYNGSAQETKLDRVMQVIRLSTRDNIVHLATYSGTEKLYSGIPSREHNQKYDHVLKHRTHTYNRN
jgi:hypothetical protein